MAGTVVGGKGKHSLEIQDPPPAKGILLLPLHPWGLPGSPPGMSQGPLQGCPGTPSLSTKCLYSSSEQEGGPFNALVLLCPGEKHGRIYHPEKKVFRLSSRHTKFRPLFQFIKCVWCLFNGIAERHFRLAQKMRTRNAACNFLTDVNLSFIFSYLKRKWMQKKERKNYWNEQNLSIQRSKTYSNGAVILQYVIV